MNTIPEMMEIIDLY